MSRNARTDLSEEDMHSIAAAYRSGDGLIPLARKHRIGLERLYGILSAHNVSRRAPGGRPKYNGHMTEAVLSLANSDHTSAAIAEQTGIRRTTVRSIIIRAGQKPLTSSQVRKLRHPVDESAFNVMTAAARYWLGFLMADGCVQDNGRISIVLKIDDRPHLEAFRKFIGANNHSILVCNGGTTLSFAATSQTLAERLRHFGIVARKSLIAEATTALAADPMFWLGVIDGDGSLCLDRSVNRPTIQLAGSILIVTQFRQYLADNFPWTPPSVSLKKNIATITITRRKAIDLIWHLWHGHHLGLRRKRHIAESYLEFFGHLRTASAAQKAADWIRGERMAPVP